MLRLRIQKTTDTEIIMKNNMKFEEAMVLLEDIVRKLESGSLPLDESLDAFSDAVKLVKICNEKLSEAEQKVKILTEGADGAIVDLPFDINNEN